MVENLTIPAIGNFQITENMLFEYMETYKRYFSKKGENTLRKNNHRYARKLAGLTLLKELYKREITFKECNAGIVYVISNIAYPVHYKIGMTLDINSRLNQYQTYDPYRQFKVEHYEFVLNRRLMEKKILNSFSIEIENGEWVKREKAKEAFLLICNLSRNMQ